MRALFALSLLTVVVQARLPDGYHPVVVAGPLVGQSLEVRDSNRGWCSTGGHWRWEWGNSADTVGDFGCLSTYLALGGWNDTTKRAIPPPGIDVRPLGGWDGGWRALSSFERPGSPSPMSLEGFRGDPRRQEYLGPRLRRTGYVEGRHFFGAPYDWRVSVGDWKETSFPTLRRTIERAMSAKGAGKVVVTGVSMAGPYIHSFLNWMRETTPGWLDEHVHAFVPMGGPFNGAVNDLTEEVSTLVQSFTAEEVECPGCLPRQMDSRSRPPSVFHAIEGWIQGAVVDYIDRFLTPSTHGWPSFYFLATGIDYSTDPPTDPTKVTLVNGALPSECTVNDGYRSKCGAQSTRNGWYFDNPEFLLPTQCAACYPTENREDCIEGYEKASNGWTGDLCCEKLTCPSRSFKASELPQLFREIGRPEAALMMEDALTQGATTADPGVPVHCIIGYNTQTYASLAFSTTEDVQSAIVTLGDGDATVDRDSLEVCSRWSSTVKTYRFPGVQHVGYLGTKDVLDVLMAVVLDDHEYLQSWTEPQMHELTSCSGCLTANMSLYDRRSPSERLGLNAESRLMV